MLNDSEYEELLELKSRNLPDSEGRRKSLNGLDVVRILILDSQASLEQRDEINRVADPDYDPEKIAKAKSTCIMCKGTIPPELVTQGNPCCSDKCYKQFRKTMGPGFMHMKISKG